MKPDSEDERRKRNFPELELAKVRNQLVIVEDVVKAWD